MQRMFRATSFFLAIGLSPLAGGTSLSKDELKGFKIPPITEMVYSDPFEDEDDSIECNSQKTYKHHQRPERNDFIRSQQVASCVRYTWGKDQVTYGKAFLKP